MKKLILLLTLPLYVLDQFTKWLVLRRIGVDDSIAVIPDWFYLVQIHNTGAAFGLLANNNLFFIALSTVALVALVVFGWRGAFCEPAHRVGAALLLAGVLGNLTDRFLHGHVVDFLLFYLHVPFANPWPAFNVADSCICVAAVVFVLSSLFEKKADPSAAAEK